MTIRSGGGARGRSQAHPAERGTSDEDWQPHYDAETHSPGADGTGSGGGHGPGGSPDGSMYWPAERRRRGIPGVLKFLIFAVVLATLVLATLVTVLRPLVRGAVLGWATDNPATLGLPFVASLVEEDLGSKLTDPASTDTTQVPFQVADGDSASTIATKLQEQGFLQDSRAFIFLATQRGLTNDLQSGAFILRRSMTPDELVTSLLAPEQVHYVEIGLRTGLRLEQITAKLETLTELQMAPKDFYQLAKHPTPELLNDYPWLKQVLPPGASLEGFLWPATYRVLPDTTAEELIRDMLDNFHAQIGDRLDVPASRGLNFYQVLTLASLVEREAVHEEDKPLIAGVFADRLDPKLFPNGHLGSDPTIFYIHDTLMLDPADLPAWTKYVFWDSLPKGYQLPAELPDDLAGYNTYTHTGLIPGPIVTPTLSSIDAALAPDTSKHYLYFLATNDGSGDIVYAKTLAEHQNNIKKYGTK
jgi:UPF0755 protein